MASERYNAPVREKHWQQVWEERDTFRTQDKSKKPKRYQLEMFPYPSGRIHMGHVRNYTLGDVMARYMRAKGFNVLHPMGWDAFGLPAENAAMERKVHPRKWTYENIDTMRAQLKAMGLSIDWEREFATCNPDYYVHQQRLFLDFLKKKLAYRKTAKVNWDPVENTVLANEQVIDGRGWRSGAAGRAARPDAVVLQDHRLRRGAAARRWTASTSGPISSARSRANWIGRSTGADMRFALEGGKLPKKLATLEVFTTRPDTHLRRLLHGDLARASAGAQPSPRRARSWPPSSRSAADRHQRGGAGKGREEGLRHRHRRDPPVQAGRQAAGLCRQLHPHGLRHGRHLRLSGATTSATSISPASTGCRWSPWCCRREPTPRPSAIGDEAYRRRRHHDQLASSSTASPSRPPRTGSRACWRSAASAQRKVNYRLRDWGISRQRYWGCPIPVIHCEKDGIVPVPDEDLPVQAAGGRHLRRARQPARPPPDVEARDVPQVRRAGGARDRHHGHVRRQLLVLRFASPRRTPTRRPTRRRCQLLAAGRPVHRRHRARDAAPAVFALLHPRHEGDTRHVETSTSRSRRCSHRAWSCTRPTAARTATGCRRPRSARGRRRHPQGVLDLDRQTGRDRRHREDVEVEQERGRPRRLRRPLRRRHRPLFMLSDSPPERDVIWTDAGVEGAGPLSPAHLAADRQTWSSADAKGRNSPAFGPEAQALRRVAHKTLNSVGQNIEALRFNVAVAQIYEFTNALSAALEQVGRRPGLGPPRGRRATRADDRPDDAAFGRGLLGAARIQHPAGRSALAGGRCRPCSLTIGLPLPYR